MRHQEHGQKCPDVVDQSGEVRGQHHGGTRAQMISGMYVTQALTSGWVCATKVTEHTDSTGKQMVNKLHAARY